MTTFRILAQHELSNARITKLVRAANATDAIAKVSAELFAASYYAISATAI